MSPVVIPNGYTREYIDGKHNRTDQLNRIHSSFDQIQQVSDTILIEGTGHSGVGSIIEINNAQVAAELKAKVVLVGVGGLGSSFDELELNRIAFEKYGAEIAGVVLNKCEPSKIPMLREYFTKLLQSRWGDVPLLGLVPLNPFLKHSTLSDLTKYLQAVQLGGQSCNETHYDAKSCMMVSSSVSPSTLLPLLFNPPQVATDVTRFLDKLEEGTAQAPVILTHITRNDIILAYLSHWQKCRVRGSEWKGALIVAAGSSSQDRVLHHHVLDTIQAMDAPVLVAGLTTYEVMQKFEDFTPKLHHQDTHRVTVACNHVCQHIDFQELAKRLRTRK
jgi:BioD-like phosphotransacetylase family protein